MEYADGYLGIRDYPAMMDTGSIFSYGVGAPAIWFETLESGHSAL
jgi:hypothetical protein